MLKIRYFRVDLPAPLSNLREKILFANKNGELKRITFIDSPNDDLLLHFTVERPVSIRRFSPDGDPEVETVMSIDIHSLRFFANKGKTFLCLIDPPRSGRLITNFLDIIFPNENYFVEPLEIGRTIINQHIAQFGAAKLVSAKIRDFQVFEGGVGRLEVSSQDGIPPGIASFLSGRHYKIDCLTYEISHLHKRGLIYYFRNGTIKVSTPLIDLALTSFELCC